MLGEENVGDVNNDPSNELNKLIESMSALNIDHKATIAVCYAQYFQQKVRKFEEIEQQIRLLIKSFKSKMSKFKIAKIPGDINKLRDKCVPITGENYNYSQTEGFIGFSWEQCFKSPYHTIAQTTTTASKSANESDVQKFKRKIRDSEMKSWNGDDFCDIIMEGDDNGDSPAVRVKAPKIVDAPNIVNSTATTSATTTSAESATIVHIDNTGAASLSSSPIITGNASNMVKASKPVIDATTSGVAEQNWVVDDYSTSLEEDSRPPIKLIIKQSPIPTGHRSHVVEASKSVLKASTSGIIKQSEFVAGHSTSMVEDARPPIKLIIKQSTILNGRSSHVVEASKSVIKASTSGIIKQSPKIDMFNIVKPPDVLKSIPVAHSPPPGIDGSNDAYRSQGGVIPIQINQEDVENLCRNIPKENHKFPARLRLKRYLAEMTGKENIPDFVQHTDADETATKRRRV
ncbi:hypothetical protein HA402_003321 [Bradysia odoriphaga]|nr:hypothetical protein HA402_003321 [Bradysia odoriphaga]